MAHDSEACSTAAVPLMCAWGLVAQGASCYEKHMGHLEERSKEWLMKRKRAQHMRNAIDC